MMSYIVIVGFIATMGGIMSNYGLFDLLKRYVGYAVCRHTGETGASVFSRTRFMAIGKYSNYSLVILYWLISIHTVFALMLFLDISLLFYHFHLAVVSSSPNSELLAEFFSNKLVFAYVINAGAIHGIDGIWQFRAIVASYFIPFVVCVLTILRRIHYFGFEVAKRDNNEKVLILVYFWLTVLFVCFVHYICSGAFIIKHPQLSFYSILFVLLLALVYGILTYAIYHYYLDLLRENSLILTITSRQFDCSMELVLRDGSIIRDLDALFYPILLEDNKVSVVFFDGRKSLSNSDVASLTVSSVLKPKGFFAHPLVCDEVSTVHYYFD